MTQKHMTQKQNMTHLTTFLSRVVLPPRRRAGCMTGSCRECPSKALAARGGWMAARFGEMEGEEFL